MNIFVATTVNLDVSEQVTIVSYHKSMSGAYLACKDYSVRKSGINVIEDPQGEVKDYKGIDIQLTSIYTKPAVYHTSHFGNYRCVTFVDTIELQD